jgi:hypothetical protein
MTNFFNTQLSQGRTRLGLGLELVISNDRFLIRIICVRDAGGCCVSLEDGVGLKWIVI